MRDEQQHLAGRFAELLLYDETGTVARRAFSCTTGRALRSSACSIAAKGAATVGAGRALEGLVKLELRGEWGGSCLCARRNGRGGRSPRVRAPAAARVASVRGPRAGGARFGALGGRPGPGYWGTRCQGTTSKRCGAFTRSSTRRENHRSSSSIRQSRCTCSRAL